MTKLTAVKPTNGKAAISEEKKVADSANVLLSAPKVNGKEPEIVAAPAVIQVKKEMTLQERIHRVDNLSLLCEKRTKLVETRSQLERFQISSNDFNCSMRLNDSDGNVFTTSFTPGIKKVIDFLKSSFDASIKEVEDQITF